MYSTTWVVHVNMSLLEYIESINYFYLVQSRHESEFHTSGTHQITKEIILVDKFSRTRSFLLGVYLMKFLVYRFALVVSFFSVNLIFQRCIEDIYAFYTNDKISKLHLERARVFVYVCISKINFCCGEEVDGLWNDKIKMHMWTYTLFVGFKEK